MAPPGGRALHEALGLHAVLRDEWERHAVLRDELGLHVVLRDGSEPHGAMARNEELRGDRSVLATAWYERGPSSRTAHASYELGLVWRRPCGWVE
jgi:hypothetical protein